MSDDSCVELARDAVDRLLAALDIATVVCVDDVYSRDISLEDLLIVQKALSEAELREIFGRPRDAFPDDPQVRQQSFRTAWDSLDPAGQHDVGKKLVAAKAAKPAEDPDEFVASSALAELVGPARLRTAPPSTWSAVKEAIKSDGSGRRTLILIDQDLSGGGHGFGATSGMSLVVDALADTTIENRVVCGLLTHTVTIENQHDEWVRLASEQSLNQDQFVVVAKGWLHRDPLGFARMLKQAALSPDCRRIKELSKQLLDEANTEAYAEIDKIHIDDFESMVFRASKLEGLWEPDMLFRIYGIFHRTAVRSRALGHGGLRDLAARLRSVSDIPTQSPTVTPPAAWKVQRQEIYDEGDYVNKFHLPIEVGDIFVRTDSDVEKHYILLGQPCDLMVRSDGKRSPENTDVVLAEVFKSSDQRRNAPELKYFSEIPGQRHYVRLRPTYAVHPCVLDLCVFNEDGVSRLDIEAPCPERVLPAWRKKHEYLRKFAVGILSRYERFGENKIKDQQALNYVRSEVPKKFPVFTSNSGLFKATVAFGGENRSLQFNCKRVLRLHPSRAAALTTEFSQYLSRPAFDRDLAE